MALKENNEAIYRRALEQLWQSLQWQHDHSPSASGCMVCAAHDATRKALALPPCSPVSPPAPGRPVRCRR